MEMLAERPKRAAKKQKGSKCIRVNCSDCGSTGDILRALIKENGWSETKTGKCDILWLRPTQAAEMLESCRTKGGVAIGRIPGVMDVCHKDILASILNIWSDVYPEDYDFVPKTFICPQELT